MRRHSCPKCQSSMSEGFVPTENHGMRAVSSWVQGTPKKSMWLGLKLAAKPVKIETWRCERCGFLESYAND